jgi:hypothetical protein
MPQDYSKRKLGVRGPSPRDIFPRFSLSPTAQHHPDEASYEADFGPIYNQGDEPDCGPHAVAGIVTMYYHKRTGKWYDYSRAAIYVQGKLQFENADFDTEGMFPATPLKVVQARGNVLEAMYPTTDANVERRTAIADALWHREFEIATFTEVDNDPESFMSALYHGGPIAMAVDWANSFFTPDVNGVLPAPDFSAGGHYVIGGAYAKWKPFLPKGGGAKIRNSWGAEWGIDGGWAWMPFEYLATQALNLYTVKVHG